MKVVEVAGSGLEMGRQAGEATREEIAHCLAIRPLKNIDALRKRLPRLIESTRRYAPDVLDEMAGIAEGSNQPLEQIYGINFLLFDDSLNVCDDDASSGGGCTNIVFAHTPDGPILGKNNDGEAIEMRRPSYIKVARPRHGIPHIVATHVGWAGMVDGMNAEGVAIGHSSVGSVFQQSDDMVGIRPWGYLSQRQAKTTAQTVAHFAELPLRGKGYAMVCVDRQGVACAIEAPCPLVQIRQPEQPGGVCCVNAYHLPALQNADRRPPDAKADALARKAMLDDVLKGDKPLTLDRMKSLLSGDEGSVCLWRRGECSHHTEWTTIALPATGRFLYTNGHPSDRPFKEISI